MSLPPPDPIYILRGLGAPVTALEFARFSNPDQQKLLSGDYTGVVNIWNLRTKRPEATLNGHNNKSILNVQHLRNDCILSHGRDGYLHIWNLQQGRNEITESFEVSDLGFCKCEILTDKDAANMKIAVSSRDQSQIDIIDIKQKQIFKQLKPQSEKPLGTKQNPQINRSTSKSHFQGMCMCLKKAKMEDGTEVLLAGYENGNIILWDTQSSKVITELNIHKEPVMCMDFDSASQRGVTGSAENILAVLTLTSQGKLEAKKTVEIKNPGISTVNIRGDSKILATGGWDNKLRIFSWKSMKPLAILNYHTQSVDALAFSQCDEKMLAAGSKDGRISLWSLYKDN